MDDLSKHFYKCVLAHSLLKQKEKNHDQLCSCNINLDTNPKIKKYFEEIKIFLKRQNCYDAEKLQPVSLSIFEHFLNIQRDLTADQAAVKRIKLAKGEEPNTKLLLFEGQTECPFCFDPLKFHDKQQSMITMEQVLFISD